MAASGRARLRGSFRLGVHSCSAPAVHSRRHSIFQNSQVYAEQDPLRVDFSSPSVPQAPVAASKSGGGADLVKEAAEDIRKSVPSTSKVPDAL